MFKCAVELPAPVRFAVAVATAFRHLHWEKKEQDQKQDWRQLNEATGGTVFAQVMEPVYFPLFSGSLIPIMPQRIEWEDATAIQTTKKAQQLNVRFEIKVFYSLGTRIDLIICCPRSPATDIEKAASWKVEQICAATNDKWNRDNMFMTPKEVAERFRAIGLDPRLVSPGN